MRQLVQQKTLVEEELWELKALLEKAGFASLSQMRSDAHGVPEPARMRSSVENALFARGQ